VKVLQFLVWQTLIQRQSAAGLSFDKCLITVPARVLQSPKIKYLGKEIDVRDGGWNMATYKLSKGATINSWGWVRFVAGYDNDGARVESTIRNFVRFMNDMGITMPMQPEQRWTAVVNIGQNMDPQTAINGLADFKKQNRPPFLLVVLPKNGDAALYNRLKKWGDTLSGMHTICVTANKFLKEMRQDQYFANVALKFNLKAGGTNHTLRSEELGIISEGKTMVVGIDVTHPSPGSANSAPSVAGMVASMDKDLAQWPAVLTVQEGRKEMVAKLDDMLLSRLKLWVKTNKTLPENIIVYRDGVSEGQFQLVLDNELPLLRKACTEFYGEKTKPSISIIIVGKRHHTRFFPSDVQNADSSWNCRSGTVVDRGVTEVRFWHFYLQSHKCLQGTARPAHYYVILDEVFRKTKKIPGRNAADTLEKLTHNMCHLFGRATKAVSICPPAYYADILCERARCYLSGVFDPATPAGSVAGGVAGDAPGPGFTDADWELHPWLKDSMFYI
jgi:eukaryotic translation initiation factor 2C